MERQKIIVGVHGIGDQARYETLQLIARQFCKHYGAAGAITLGRYHSEFSVQAGGYASGVFFPHPPADPPLKTGIGFAEVYWADIPRKIVNDGYTLEQANTWANAIVERLRVVHEQSRSGTTSSEAANLSATDFAAIKAVLTEMLETLNVIERLVFLADRAGIFKFDLKRLLDNFLGDVQIVTEFAPYRKEIIYRFRQVMRGINRSYPDAEIHIIAHSEGTVVTLLGLLETMSNSADQQDHGWLNQVRGLMTIGSPIDKHIVLWPALWDEIASAGWRNLQAASIKWRNYYDFGDPVGYELDTARYWLRQNGLEAFEFRNDPGHKHDFGFSRYALPGKAHVDYWDDQDLFNHFIGDVIDGAPGRQKPPESRLWARAACSIVSFLLVLLTVTGAVYLLYKAVAICLSPDAGVIGALMPSGSAAQFIGNLAGLSLLLAGLTVASRLPRLTRRPRFYFASLAIFTCTTAGGGLLAKQAFHDLGMLILQMISCSDPLPESLLAGGFHQVMLGVIALLVLLLSWGVKPTWGKRTLLLSGSVSAAALVAALVSSSQTHGRVWPVILAMALFFYLWWLAILLFDLVYTWHCYIRQSGALKRMYSIYADYDRQRKKS